MSSSARVMTGRYVMYGAPHSYYSAKLRSYLQYRGIDFEERLATLEVYRDVILPKTGVSFIPIIVTPDGDAIQDTTVIIDYFEKSVKESESIYPRTPKQKTLAMLIELYEEYLTIPAMYYRWHFPENLSSVSRDFAQMLAPGQSAEVQREMIKGPMHKFRSATSLLGVTPEQTKGEGEQEPGRNGSDKDVKVTPGGTKKEADRTNWKAIEDWTYHLLVTLDTHFASSQPFLFGTRPSIADFSLFGFLSGHLYRDPAPRQMMKKVSSAVCDWVERMRSFKGPQDGDDFLEGDVICDTLLPLFGPLVHEFIPFLLQTDQLLSTHLEQKKTKKGKNNSSDFSKLPRVIGALKIRVGGGKNNNDAVETNRIATPYPLWMLQRILDTVHNTNTTSTITSLTNELELVPHTRELSMHSRQCVLDWIQQHLQLDLRRVHLLHRFQRISNSTFARPKQLQLTSTTTTSRL